MKEKLQRGGRPRAILSTGMFREHLLNVGEDYPFRMYQLLKEKKKAAGIEEKGIGSYQNFRNYLYWLRKLGLIELAREEPSENPHFQPRRCYRIVEGMEDAEGWVNPRKHLYPESWKKHRS